MCFKFYGHIFVEVINVIWIIFTISLCVNTMIDHDIIFLFTRMHMLVLWNFHDVCTQPPQFALMVCKTLALKPLCNPSVSLCIFVENEIYNDIFRLLSVVASTWSNCGPSYGWSAQSFDLCISLISLRMKNQVIWRQSTSAPDDIMREIFSFI